MNLKQLEYFVVSAEERNITSAGKKLHLSQPPLSRQIQLLEEDMGVTLMLRGNKGIELTEAGEILYQRAKTILRDMDEMREILNETKTGIRGRIRIGVCYSTFPTIMKQMRCFLKENNMAEFSFVYAPLDELYEGLYNSKIDFLCMRHCVLDNQDFSYQMLEEDIVRLCIHKDLDPCPDEDNVGVDYIQDLPLCVLDESKYPGHNNFLINACNLHGFSPHIVCDCYDTSVAMALALSGIAATFQPESVIVSYAHPNLRVKHIPELETTSHPVLIWNKTRYLSRCAEKFLNQIKSQETVDHLISRSNEWKLNPV